MYIAIRVAHGPKLQLQPHHVYNLVRGVGLAFPHECFKLLPVPLPRLLQRGGISAGQQQPQEVPHIPRQRLHAVLTRVHGAYRKDGLPKALYGAEMDAITAVVLGGTSMSGGVGTIGGTIIGCLIVGVLNNGMNLLGIDSSWQYVVQGAVVLIAVLIDFARKEGVFKRKRTD